MISLDYKGFFWEEFDENQKPINPKECQIIFNPKDGGVLRFFIEPDKVKIAENIKCMYGQIDQNKKITLYNLKYKASKHNATQELMMKELEYSVQYIYYRDWIDTSKSIEIMYVRYSYFEVWLNPLEIHRPTTHNNKTGAGVIVDEYNILNKDLEYSFNISYEYTDTLFNNKIVVFEFKKLLSIFKKSNFNLQEMIDLSLVLKSFFEIIIFYSKNNIFIEEIYIPQKGKSIANSRDDDRTLILFKQDDYIEEQEISHIDFLFRYDDVKENFDAILNNWIENHYKNQNEYQAFCNVIADKTSKFNIYSHYFQLISALEGYHTRNSQKDIEFRKRLNELIKKSDMKNVLALSSKMHKSIANCIYDLRNDIAHSKKTIEISSRIKSSFEYLKLVALLIMLKDISLNHAQISKNIFDMDIKYMKKKLIESFAKNPRV